MTDRIKGYVVTLEKDVRTDDAESITNAIRMLKGVIKVEPVMADYNDSIVESRVRHELGNRIWEVIYPNDQS